MTKSNFALLLIVALALFSCKKDISGENGTTTTTGDSPIFGRGGGGTGGDATTPFPFGLLGMNGGTFTINSATNLTADVGYSSAVTSTTNQKIDHFTGTASVHTSVTSFIYTAATYQPTGGIIRNDATADAALDNANNNAIVYSANFASMPADYNYAAVATNLSLNAINHNTVVHMSSMDFNSNTLTLTGTAGNDDGFIINVDGSFDFSQSEIKLINIRAERVIFNFPNASNITVNKSANKWNGTILAPTGTVSYHNPASFNGSIIAKNIAVHSDFNLTQKSYDNGF